MSWPTARRLPLWHDAAVGTSRARRVAAAAIASGAGAVTTIAATLGIASYFARRVVTPEQDKADDAVILEVDADSTPPTLVLLADDASTVPGRYGLWLPDGGHARVGDVLEHDEDHARVTRELLGVDRGQIVPGGARWNGAYFLGPPDAALDLPCEHVDVPGELGDLPAWLIRPEQPSGTWAILVHGRASLRDEAIRALPLLRERGITSLVVSYRNDNDAPASLDGRYGLGLHEWRDLDAAMAFAVDAGAERLVLFGWSMGGATVLQTLDRSTNARYVDRVVLDGPVVDWADVFRHQAAINRLPTPIGRIGATLLGGRLGRRTVGLREPLDLELTDWVTRAERLRHPMLIIHSDDDDYVPNGPSRALAAARPDLVTFEPWDTAQHCREWNTDPQRWERVVRDYLAT